MDVITKTSLSLNKIHVDKGDIKKRDFELFDTVTVLRLYNQVVCGVVTLQWFYQENLFNI